MKFASASLLLVLLGLSIALSAFVTEARDVDSPLARLSAKLSSDDVLTVPDTDEAGGANVTADCKAQRKECKATYKSCRRPHENSPSVEDLKAIKLCKIDHAQCKLLARACRLGGKDENCRIERKQCKVDYKRCRFPCAYNDTSACSATVKSCKQTYSKCKKDAKECQGRDVSEGPVVDEDDLDDDEEQEWDDDVKEEEEADSEAGSGTGSCQEQRKQCKATYKSCRQPFNSRANVSDLCSIKQCKITRLSCKIDARECKGKDQCKIERKRCKVSYKTCRLPCEYSDSEECKAAIQKCKKDDKKTCKKAAKDCKKAK